MRVAFEELLPRLGDYELLLERVERTRNPNLRGYQALPIRFWACVMQLPWEPQFDATSIPNA
ncbi:MAG: hypothetical protein ABIV47_23035 [Roseiflexaceae bacterium]